MHIVWFKRDLRIYDHEALTQAARMINNSWISGSYFPPVELKFIWKKTKTHWFTWNAKVSDLVTIFAKISTPKKLSLLEGNSKT